MKNGKDINLLIREALLRRKEGRPEVMLPEGFEDKVMEQIKAMPQLPSGKKRAYNAQASNHATAACQLCSRNDCRSFLSHPTADT